jgi:PBP1b-binding outer membrane lipoprotein LpoB
MLKKMSSLTAPIFLILFVLFIAGCQKKEEKPIQQTPITTDTTAKVTPPAEGTTKKADVIVDIKGKYTGTFDKRPTVLNIKEQDGNKFKGSITINYREVINQQVSGEFDPKTLKFSMTDLLHSRFQGKYNGNFSEDKEKMSGTFTMALDGSKFNFNFTKKQ